MSAERIVSSDAGDGVDDHRQTESDLVHRVINYVINGRLVKTQVELVSRAPRPYQAKGPRVEGILGERALLIINQDE